MSDTHFELWNARYGYNTGNNAIYPPIGEGARRAQPQDAYGFLRETGHQGNHAGNVGGLGVLLHLGNDHYGAFGMGDTAENVAEAYGIQREAMDEFAFGPSGKSRGQCWRPWRSASPGQ